MKPILFTCLLITLTSFFGTANTARTVKDSSTSKVFAGTTPCGNIIRPLHNIIEEADCELVECHCVMVEWKLTLYHHPVTLKATTYKLTSVNRFTEKETNMYSQPGTKAEAEGKWTIIKGTKTNPDAIVYQLNPDKPKLSINFVNLNENLLHILDKDDKLMIGNEFWSYTLSRVSIN